MVRYRTALIATALLAATGVDAFAQRNGAEDTQAFVENGIHVVIAPASNQIVSVIIGLEGGVASNETTNPELGDFTADLITDSGSEKYPKENYRAFRSVTSTSIIGGGDYRGINYTMNATLPNFDKAWDVLSSLILQPTYDAVDFQNIQQRRILAVKNRWTNPEAQARQIADSIIRLGNPVLSRQTSIEDVQAIDIPMIRDFQKRLSERSRMFIIVVGNVRPEDIRQKLKAFDGLPAGTYSRVKIPALREPAGPGVHVTNRDVVTTYIYGAFPGPQADESDFWALRVGMSHLGSNLWKEVRTKRNLSYAPGAFLTTVQGHGIGMMSVSTTRPDSTIGVMLTELAKMRRGEIDETELENSKQVFLTQYYMGQMTNESRARSLYAAGRNTGDWRNAFIYDNIMGVNKADVEKAFRRYAHDMQFGIVGKEQNVTKEKFMFAK